MLRALLSASILSSLLLSGCSRVKIFDDAWCVDAGKYGAKCFNAISNVEYSLNKYQWDKLRVGQACTATERPALGYTHIKTAIEKLCADTSLCTPEQKAAIESVGKKVDQAMTESDGAPPFAH